MTYPRIICRTSGLAAKGDVSVLLANMEGWRVRWSVTSILWTLDSTWTDSSEEQFEK